MYWFAMQSIALRVTARYAETMSNKRNTKVVTISLTLEQLDKLDRIATEAGRTRSNAVARWIDAAKEPK